MAIFSFTFTVGGIADGSQTPVSQPAVNIFPVVAPLGGYNLDGVLTTLGDPPDEPDQVIPQYSLVMTLNPAVRQPGQGAALRIQVFLDNSPANDVFHLVLTSTNPSVSPLPSTVITDGSGMVSFEVVALGLGSTNFSATLTIGGGGVIIEGGDLALETGAGTIDLESGLPITTEEASSVPADGEFTYFSNVVVLTVLDPVVAENYDMTGLGAVVLSLENSLSRGLFANPQRLSHEEQWAKHPGDTGLRRAAYFANVDIVFMPGFLVKRR